MGGGKRKVTKVEHDYRKTKECLVKLIDMLQQTLMNVSTLQDVSDSSGMMVSSLDDLHKVIISDYRTITTAMTRVLHALAILARDVSLAAKGESN